MKEQEIFKNKKDTSDMFGFLLKKKKLRVGHIAMYLFNLYEL
jgi:hypothetical protein